MPRIFFTLIFGLVVFAFLPQAAKADCATVNSNLNASTAALLKAQNTNVGTSTGLLTRLRLIQNTIEPMAQADEATGPQRDCESVDAINYYMGLVAWRGLLLAATDSQLQSSFPNNECKRYAHLEAVDSLAKGFTISTEFFDSWNPDANGLIVQKHVVDLTNVLAQRFRITLPPKSEASAFSDKTEQALVTQKALMTTTCEASTMVPKAIIVFLFGKQ